MKQANAGAIEWSICSQALTTFDNTEHEAGQRQVSDPLSLPSSYQQPRGLPVKPGLMSAPDWVSFSEWGSLRTIFWQWCHPGFRSVSGVRWGPFSGNDVTLGFVQWVGFTEDHFQAMRSPWVLLTWSLQLSSSGWLLLWGNVSPIPGERHEHPQSGLFAFSLWVLHTPLLSASLPIYIYRPF